MSITIQSVELTTNKVSPDQFIELKTAIIRELSSLVKSPFSWKKGFAATIDHNGIIKASRSSWKLQTPQFIGHVKLLDNGRVEIRGKVFLSYLPIVMFLLVSFIPLCTYLMTIIVFQGTRGTDHVEYFLLLLLLVGVINAISFLRFGKEIEKVIIKAATPYLVSRA
ncbi:hypothetical protein [Roseivirga sp.]|uniref:hypothetical protein n=1 Tax=Roseivirga sp. TaxID=1964215 RepID=UPI003B528B7D